MSDQVVGINKVVFFTYSITDETGLIVEQSDMPIGYVHGVESDIIAKLEKAMQGKQLGDHLEVMLTPKEGFGEFDPVLTFTDDLENVPAEFHHIGDKVEMKNKDGEIKAFIVSKIEGGKLTVDGNHPFAGKHITFNITITAIRDASAEEILAGKPEDSMPHVLH